MISRYLVDEMDVIDYDEVGNFCKYEDVEKLIEQNKKLISLLEEAIYEGVIDNTDPKSYYYNQIADDWKKDVLKYIEEIKE